MSRRIYAFGVLNTVNDFIVSLHPAEDRVIAHLEAGEKNWHKRDFHIVVPLVAASRAGDFRA